MSNNYLFGSFSRLSDFPVDDRYIFENLNSIKKYITSVPTTAYHGQQVFDSSTGDLYVIRKIDDVFTLQPIILKSEDYEKIVKHLEEYLHDLYNGGKYNVEESREKVATAFGTHTIAENENQFVVGSYNEKVDDSLFIVGNGSEDTRSNAFVVNRDGRASVAADPINDNDVVNLKTLNSNINKKHVDTESSEIELTPLANHEYYYNTLTSLSLTFDNASVGDLFYITFTSGETATTLTVDSNNAVFSDFVPEMNCIIEICGKYNGTAWIILFHQTEV